MIQVFGTPKNYTQLEPRLSSSMRVAVGRPMSGSTIRSKPKTGITGFSQLAHPKRCTSVPLSTSRSECSSINIKSLKRTVNTKSKLKAKSRTSSARSRTAGSSKVSTARKAATSKGGVAQKEAASISSKPLGSFGLLSGASLLHGSAFWLAD